MLKQLKPTFFLVLFNLLFSFTTIAQYLSNDEKVNLDLAVQHYQKKEYEQAIHYLEKIKGNSSYNNNVYHYLYRSYIELEEFKKAEKVIKQQIKQQNNNPDYVIDLGYLYGISGKPDDAQKEYESVIKDLPNDQHQIIEIANRFIGLNELEYAKQTYIKGKKKIKTYPFNFELAGIYGLLQDYENMVEEYLGLLEINEGYAQSVQNALQSSLSNSTDTDVNNLLRISLLRKIQKDPGKDAFAEMLIWLFVQQKDFEGAFLQARALDKRNNESGNRMVALAKLSASNRDYESAIKCYQYVIDKGEDGMRYHIARKGLVHVYNEKIVQSSYSQNDLNQLENLYKNTLNDLGLNNSTIDLAIGLAHLEAFFLNKKDTAISILKESLLLPGVQETDLALTKIELGDIYVLKNRIWDASLLYSQVEGTFKYDQLGEIAKFKNAKVFYYSGDFNWSKAQLDVLKGSTSKLISNDAMELSLLISDNTTLDTNKLPLQKFANAELLILQNKTNEAMAVLDSISYLFPSHSLYDEILFKKYEIYFKEKNYSEAGLYLEKLFESGTRKDILSDNAIFLLAKLNEQYLNNKPRAMKLYNILLKDYANSIYATEARKRFRNLRGDENYKDAQPGDVFFNGGTRP